MSTSTQPVPSSTEQTEHPHIVRVQGIGGGKPIAKGTRISVRLISEYYKAGMLAEEIRRDYPYLNLAAIYDARHAHGDPADHNADGRTSRG